MKNRNAILVIILMVIMFGMAVYKSDFSKINIKDNKKTDAIKFKEEYESFNGTIAKDNIKYPTVSIKDSNPFVYSTEEEIVELLNNGTGLIYLGFPTCPWCRNSVNVLSYLNIDKIHYLNMKEIRDVYELVDGKLSKTKDGSEKYYKMLEKLDSIINDYVITDENGNTYDTLEKRIYVPLVVGVKNGKIVGYHANTVELKENQTPYDELDNNQKEELKNIYDDIKNKIYDDMCGLDDTGC